MTSWLGVVSADHVKRALAEEVCQVCHGKAGPLMRMQQGDKFMYYSPRTSRAGGSPLKAFTAAGIIADDSVYQFEQTSTFKPFRRRVAWDPNFCEVPLADVAASLELTADKNWGYSLRRGLIPLSDSDFNKIFTSGKGIQHVWS